MAKNYKPYNPEETEKETYKLWDQSGYFNPDNCIQKGITSEDADSFSIVLPPPNVTGNLHVGHSLMLAVEDAFVRFERMRGKKTLWVPGTDHAAIATQSKVEKEIYDEEGKSRHDLGREKFLNRVESFAQKSHDTIITQLKKMGASLDWSREAFTLDEKRERAVRYAFKEMYEAGLIYRGDRVVNWDPVGQTTVSDDEVEHEEVEGKLYTFRYAKDFPIPISTTRPETKLGDTAVAVNPEDSRYKEFVGQTFETEFLGEPLTIKVVADEEVDSEYGTGALGVTPAHSYTDWQMHRRHDLDLKQVINEQGEILTSGEFEGLSTLEARREIVSKLREKGLLENEEDITMNLSKAQRTGGVIEPLPKKQWFVDVDKKFKIQNSKFETIETGEEVTLKELMERVVEGGEVSIYPERFEKVYFHWIENLRDWCISRQIWYGHRIPVWYKSRNNAELNTEPRGDGEVYVGVEPPEEEGNWEQDPDTLDTWFSSGLWTFSTLGWPEETEDLKTYHPTNLLETGYDILFFWVARMILMTGFLLEEVPFKSVYLHGLVRDEKNRKMSKSLGNSVDPLDVIEEFGADALRLTLIFGTAVGNDQPFSDEKVKGMRNFVNKVYNINRFIRMNLEGHEVDENFNGKLKKEDQEIISQSSKVVKEATENIENYRLSDALQLTYDFVWNEFASEYLEAVKDRLYDEKESAPAARFALVKVFLQQLKILHPFMPFVTEDLYQQLKEDLDWEMREFLMIEDWPEGSLGE